MIRINRREYAWGDVNMSMLGSSVEGVTVIEYKKKKAKEARFGAGRHAKSIQHGKIECDGTITLMHSEIIALSRAAKQKGYDSLLDFETDIIVSYISEEGIITTDKIVCVSFTELPKGMKEGDLQSEHALPFIALDIQENI